MEIERTTIIWNELGHNVHEMVLHVRPTYTQKALCGASVNRESYQTGIGITNCPRCIEKIKNSNSYDSLGVLQHGNSWFKPMPPPHKYDTES